jgi:hypothetical protein
MMVTRIGGATLVIVNNIPIVIFWDENNNATKKKSLPTPTFLPTKV